MNEQHDGVTDNSGVVPIDRGPGSGASSATDSWIDGQETKIEANDGRSRTRTTFYDDSNTRAERHQLHRDPDDRSSWTDLAQWNDGMWDSDRAVQNRDADRRRWIETFASALELGDVYRERTEAIIFDDLDELIADWRIPHEKIVLATLSVVFDDGSKQTMANFEIEDWIVYWDEFEALMDSINMDRSELWSIRKKIVAESTVIGSDVQRAST